MHIIVMYYSILQFTTVNINVYYSIYYTFQFSMANTTEWNSTH